MDKMGQWCQEHHAASGNQPLALHNMLFKNIRITVQETIIVRSDGGEY